MIYFISGHRDITESEFNRHYVPQLQVTLSDPMAEYVVGDCMGADTMTQRWLADNGQADRVTVYHMFVSPRNKDPRILKTAGGFESDNSRDSAMTEVSNVDIAWIRSGRWTSGTAQNILRRKTMKGDNEV